MAPNEQAKQGDTQTAEALGKTNSTPPKPSWYKADIGPRLKPATRELYKNYSGLADEEVVPHLHAIRDRAWPFGEYPCVGEWIFLLSSVSRYPQYAEVLSRMKSGATVLDLGCCFGQDLRRLAADGAPTENMIASDLHSELWELGYDLFRDRDKMRARFIKTDILAPNAEFQALKGKVDFVFMCQFLHLFSWDGQVEALKKAVEMSRPGAMFLGYQIGRTEAAEVERSWGKMFFQNEESFRRIMRQVGEETGTRWDVEVSLGSQAEWGLELEDFEWMGPMAKGLNFVVTRVDGGEGSKTASSL